MNKFDLDRIYFPIMNLHRTQIKKPHDENSYCDKLTLITYKTPFLQ